jgi:hypothetical protein
MLPDTRCVPASPAGADPRLASEIDDPLRSSAEHELHYIENWSIGTTCGFTFRLLDTWHAY